MSTLVISMSSPKSLKRSYDEATLQDDLPEHAQNSTAPVISPRLTRLPSSPPSPSSQLALKAEPTIKAASPEQSTKSAGSAAKRAKLTFAEKEARRIEKEFKDRQKAEERAKKDEEKAQREKEKVAKEEERVKRAEEKKAKDVERRKVKEEKDRTREEEKVKKEEEKHKRDEEKIKKERSQLRLNAFFMHPSVGSRSPTGSPRATPTGSRRGSLAENDVRGEPQRSRSVSVKAEEESRVTPFERHFPPFFVHANVNLAPMNRFSRDTAGLAYAQDKINEALLVKREEGFSDQRCNVDTHELLNLPPRKKFRRSCPSVSVKSIVALIDGAALQSTDLTGSMKTTTKPTDLLKTIPRKFLKYYEDVRPPYVGTFTRITSPTTAAKIARNPFIREMPNTDYDYDSEAEWEDPGEGEELLSEDEEEPEEEDDGEMGGFLDDEEATDARNPRRRPLIGEQQPVCSGICWVDQPGGPDLSSYSIDMLTEIPAFPINPYSTSYWPGQEPRKLRAQSRPLPSMQPKSMDPPSRIPLRNLPKNTSTNKSHRTEPSTPPNNSFTPAAGSAYNTLNLEKPKRLIPSELHDDFKKAVEGSDLTKVGLVELLKKRFPKQSKDQLRDTLDAYFERKGMKLAERKWVRRDAVKVVEEGGMTQVAGEVEKVVVTVE